MKRASSAVAQRAATDDVARLHVDVLSDGDPRDAMARVNARIVAFQSKGLEVPAELLRLNKALAAECVAQSQGR